MSNISAELLRNEIVKEITRAKFFSIMADEDADVSVKEQLSLVIRSVDDKSNIREEFLEFIHCKNIRGWYYYNLAVSDRGSCKSNDGYDAWRGDIA